MVSVDDDCVPSVAPPVGVDSDRFNVSLPKGTGSLRIGTVNVSLV